MSQEKHFPLLAVDGGRCMLKICKMASHTAVPTDNHPGLTRYVVIYSVGPYNICEFCVAELKRHFL